MTRLVECPICHGNPEPWWACFTCDDSGTVPSYPLVPVRGGDGPLITVGYIEHVFALAYGFIAGWRAALVFVWGEEFATDPQYAFLRDGIMSIADIDYLVACRIALFLTIARGDDEFRFRSFGPPIL